MPDKKIVIVADDLREHLDDPDWVTIDCRFAIPDPVAGRRAYEEQHLPGAVFLDLDEDLAGPVTAASGRHPLPAVEEIVATLASFGVSNTSTVVVYDDGNGAIAARAWWILRWLGHDDVYLLDGGYKQWCAQGMPTTASPTQRSSGRFTPSVRSDQVLTTAELEDAVGQGISLKLLDAREGTRFRGEAEPIDSVAGHVPGASNLWFGDLVQPDGTWRPLSERSALLRDKLGADLRAPWSVMCGSGVTACHLAITAVEAGFPEPRVYVGSWSEWIRDPDRPVGVGEG